MCHRTGDVVLADDPVLYKSLPEQLVLPVLWLGEDGGDVPGVYNLHIDEDLAEARAAGMDAVVVLFTPSRNRAGRLELLLVQPSPLHATPIRCLGPSSISLG